MWVRVGKSLCHSGGPENGRISHCWKAGCVGSPWLGDEVVRGARGGMCGPQSMQMTVTAVTGDREQLTAKCLVQALEVLVASVCPLLPSLLHPLQRATVPACSQGLVVLEGKREQRMDTLLVLWQGAGKEVGEQLQSVRAGSSGCTACLCGR